MFPKVKDYSGVDEALAAVMAKLRRRPAPESVRAELAYGRVLAQDVVSPTDIPPFSTSHMDGFAVLSLDVEEASQGSPVTLRVTGESKLGSRTTRSFRSGETVRVSTGSRIPDGADAVIPVESVSHDGKVVTVVSKQLHGSFVYPKGRDFGRGEVVLRAGRRLRAQDVGLLLTVGVARVKVNRTPRVSVVATGSELTGSASPAAGKVRNSHSPYFLGLVEASGCVPVDLGIVKDEKQKVARAIRRGLAASDFVITLGGTSLGKRDVVGDAVSSLGPEVSFHGVRMDRGRVGGVAVIEGKPVLMAPGPIQGAMTAFVLFGVPLMGRLSGADKGEMEIVCSMKNDWEARRQFPNFTKVVYVRLGAGAAEPLIGETESSRLMAEADGYLVVPEATTRIAKGTMVTVRLLPGFTYV